MYLCDNLNCLWEYLHDTFLSFPFPLLSSSTFINTTMIECAGRCRIHKVGECGRNTQHYLSASGANTNCRFNIFVSVFLKQVLVLETFILLLFQQKNKKYCRNDQFNEILKKKAEQPG